MIWPGNLVAVALMNAMYETHEHMDSNVLGGTIPRYKWFGMMTVFAFFYYFIPGFLAQCLSMFAFVTWIFPQSPIVNQLFGGLTGLSFLPITFDWAQITGYIGSPLVPPWYVSVYHARLRYDPNYVYRHAIANTTIGVVTIFMVLSSLLHYFGAWGSQFLPMSDTHTYDNTGQRYDINRVLTADFTLDEEAYKNYSPLFIRYARSPPVTADLSTVC